MHIQRVELDELPDLTAMVRRAMGTEEVALFRIGSGTILVYSGEMRVEDVPRTAPHALIRCKEGGGYEMSRNV